MIRPNDRPANIGLINSLKFDGFHNRPCSLITVNNEGNGVEASNTGNCDEGLSINNATLSSVEVESGNKSSLG